MFGFGKDKADDVRIGKIVAYLVTVLEVMKDHCQLIAEEVCKKNHPNSFGTSTCPGCKTCKESLRILAQALPMIESLVRNGDNSNQMFDMDEVVNKIINTPGTVENKMPDLQDILKKL